MTDRRDEAVSTMEKTAAMKPGSVLLQGFVAWAYGAAGLIEKARSIVDAILARDSDNPPALALAWGYTGLGDKENALNWLEKAFRDRELDLIFIQAPEFRQVLGTEPRYQELRKKLRLEGPGS